MTDGETARDRVTPRTVSASEGLRAIERRPRGALRTILRHAAVQYRPIRASTAVTEPPTAPGYRDAIEIAKPDGSIAPPALAHAARLQSFRHLGVYAFAGIIGMIRRDAWASSDGRTRLSFKRDDASTFHAGMSPYILSTMFDDGTGIETFGGATPAGLVSSERIAIHGGTGDLHLDFPRHDRAVDEYLDAHPQVRALRCESIADSTAMSMTFDTTLQPDSVVRIFLALRFSVYGLVLVVLLAFLMRLFGP